jgi:hypothetical protein
VAETDGPKVAICAIAKNEAPYLEEWTAYHHILGFDPIRVYSHEPEDDSDTVLDRLARHGLLEWTPWSVHRKLKPQWVAYEDGLEKLRGRATWIAFIDLDEFVVLPQHDTIQAFLGDYGDLDAIAMNWKLFGSSGHLKREPGLVIERFRRCSRRDYSGNRQVKTLAKAAVIQKPFVHTCLFTPGTKYQTVAGETLPPRHSDDPTTNRPVGETENVSHDVIRINHYFTRSQEEWDEKARRGRGAKPASHPLKHRTHAEFEQNDRNEADEVDIGRLAPRVKSLIQEVRRGSSKKGEAE